MTSPFSAAGRAATRPRSAPPSSGAKVVCIEKEPELGGTCLRVGCIPTKAWVQTAFALKEAEETFAQVRRQGRRAASSTSRPANEWKDGVVKQMTGGVASLFKANGVEWVKGKGRFKDANTIAVEGGEDVTFKSAIVATGSFPLRPPIDGPRLAALRRLDRPARADRGAAPARRARRRHHRLRVRLDLQPLRHRGDDRRDARHADPAGGRGRGEGAREAVRQARHRAPARQAVHEGRGRRLAADRPLRRGRDRRGRPDARLGRPRAARRGARARGDRRRSSTGARASPPTSTAARRVPHIYAVGDCAGYWQLAHTAFREGEVAAENACGHDAIVDNRARAAPDLHRPGDRRRRPDRGARRASSTATTSRSASSRGSRTRAP